MCMSTSATSPSADYARGAHEPRHAAKPAPVQTRARHDKRLNRTLFERVQHTQFLLDDFTRYYNDGRPHSSLNHLTSAEFSAIHSAVDS
jgi:transposase InsO family protein